MLDSTDYNPWGPMLVSYDTLFFPTALAATHNVIIIVPLCMSHRHYGMYIEVCTVTPLGGGSGGDLS